MSLPVVRFTIDGIPALLWGSASDRVYIYVHGKMSCKEDAGSFALLAAGRGYQTLSFDLPEHGERADDDDQLCVPWNAVKDLLAVYDFAERHWRTIALYATSLGAYFSLLAYPQKNLDNCLFLSPILDMNALIHDMMIANNVSMQQLQAQQEIEIPGGEPLSWEYYRYAANHPITEWDFPTSILYASADNLTSREIVDEFSREFGCRLTILEGGEHWFHTPEQLDFLNTWLAANI